jgi:hypothetical protein
LYSAPLRIDAVIIKKSPNAVIDIPLGAIFRGVNIIEYKSPGHSLSIADYLKAGAYARLYSVLSRTAITGMTLSFVVESYPRKLLNYLGEEFGYEINEKWPGIYYVGGGEVGGVQVVETKKLREEDGGIWLRGMRGDLRVNELRGIMERGRKMPEGAPLAAYLHMVFRANRVGFEEIVKMADGFEEVLERHGFIAKWKEAGREEGWEEAVRRLQKYGMDPVEIAKALELPLAVVFKYLGAE